MKAKALRSKIIEFLTFIIHAMIALAEWLFVWPLSLIITRNPDLIIVISRADSSFADNSKYFYVYSKDLTNMGKRVVFLTGDHKAKDMINNAGGEAIIHPSFQSVYLLIKCRVIVTDWVLFDIYPIIRGAKYVQLWHGAPLKHIELDIFNKRLQTKQFWFKIILSLQKVMTGRYPKYDLLVTTSNDITKYAFHSCIKARDYCAYGYPRNDILFDWANLTNETKALVNINIDRQVIEEANKMRLNGNKVCLYVPTFRKDMSNPFEKNIDMRRLSDLSQQHNLFMVFKLHPLMYRQYNIDRYPHLIEYSPIADVYPLLRLTDILITDYSSIYFDFLLLDRPIIFFPYDLDNYLKNDRDMYFDYYSMTPGPKCHNYDELEYNLELLMNTNHTDDFADFRAKVTAFTHDYADNKAHQRLNNAIMNL
jgi:CDP-glycerol glycerophosphotransferase (TagB/SpsB family)